MESSIAYLKLTRDEFSAHIILDLGKPFDKFTVGAAILRFNGLEPQILLLKRREDEEHYPAVFEIPGGKIDATDATIRDAIVREVKEESDLAVTDIVHPLSVITYTTEKPAMSASKDNKPLKCQVIQLSYVVTVDDSKEFKVNETEHSIGVWANTEMLKKLVITHEMKDLVLEALHWAKST